MKKKLISPIPLEMVGSGWDWEGSAGPPNFASYSYTKYQPVKYTLDDSYFNNSGYNAKNLPLMRYAEVLLNFAAADGRQYDYPVPAWPL